MVDVLIMQTPEGHLRCNECDAFVVDVDEHARQVHPRGDGRDPDVMVVHSDDE